VLQHRADSLGQRDHKISDRTIQYIDDINRSTGWIREYAGNPDYHGILLQETSMKHSAIALVLCVLTLLAGMAPCRADEKKAAAAIETLGGWVVRRDNDPDQSVVGVAFWYHPALSDAELKSARREPYTSSSAWMQ